MGKIPDEEIVDIINKSSCNFRDKQPHISAWNKGFTVGKIGFIAQQTYKETCKRKK